MAIDFQMQLETTIQQREAMSEVVVDLEAQVEALSAENVELRERLGEQAE